MGVVGIYCIENKIDGKKYIGRSIDINGRFMEHKRLLRKNKHSNQYLQNVYNKHGVDSLMFYIVEKCLIDELNEKEVYYIKKFLSKSPDGYNFTDGGDGFIGYKQTDESRLKRSINFSGDKNHMFGKTHSPEAREKISKSQLGVKGYLHSSETKNKISESHKGKTVSEESKKKMSITKSGEQRNKKNNSSKYYGVVRYKNKWRARFICNQIEYNLGFFEDEIEAAKAVDIKNYEIRGENAILNFPK